MSEVTTIEAPSTPVETVLGSAAELLEERNEWLEKQLNPGGSLPKVKLEEVPLPDGCQSNFLINYEIKDESGQPVGSVKLATPSPTASERGEKAHIQNIQAIQGQGFGKATYLELLKTLPMETGLKSSDQLSRGSHPMWRWLVEAGVAQQVSPGVVDETARNGGYSSTRYETKF